MFTQDLSDSFELVTVQSGVRSLRSLANKETFHPVIGPAAEASILHVQQQRLTDRAAATGDRFVIWDVGLGAAANAVAVLEAFRNFRGSTRIELHSFDRTTAPLEFALSHAAELAYPEPHAIALRRLLDEREVELGALTWRLHLGDFRNLPSFGSIPAPHSILYDPFSPQSNPTMWSLECFSMLHGRLSPDAPCMLSNYTRSTAVRVTLLLAGFYVGRGCGVAEKDQTTVAANTPELLEAPLDSMWLRRVERSTAAAPLRDSSNSRGRISELDLATLFAHPQFRAPTAAVN